MLGKFEVDVTGVYKGSVFKAADATGSSKAAGEETGRFMTVDGKHISIFSEKSPVNLPWKQLGVDLVIEVGVLKRYVVTIVVADMGS